VIRKRLRRKLRDQAFGSNAARRELPKVRRLMAIEIIPAEPVDRHEDEDRALGRRRRRAARRQRNGESKEQLLHHRWRR
jgi:hypothetical protein